MRANVAKPAPPGLVDDHDPVAGSNRSAPSVAVVPSLSTLDPPCTKTLPFGRSTELPSTRAPEGISPILTQAGVDLEKSMISVVAVAFGTPPPKIITRGPYFGGSNGRRTELPYLRYKPVEVCAKFTVQVWLDGSNIFEDDEPPELKTRPSGRTCSHG